MVSTGLEALDSHLVDGFPDQSAILLVGPPGIGKEGICYRFLHSSLTQGDVAVYVTRGAVHDVLEDARGYGVNLEGPLQWVDCSGAPGNTSVMNCNMNDLTAISVGIKRVAADNSARRIRIVIDVLSPLLLLNPLETMYRLINSLVTDLKKYDSVTVVTLEDGMHSTRDIVAFEQFFDGVVEMKMYEEGMKILPLLRIKKMRGLPPKPGYLNFRFTPDRRMEISAYAK